MTLKFTRKTLQTNNNNKIQDREMEEYRNRHRIISKNKDR